MARIILDPDDVNQDREVTLTDGSVVVLDDADTRTLDRIARQLHDYRPVYVRAFVGDDDELTEAVRRGDEPVESHAPLHLRLSRLRARLTEEQRHRRPPSDLDPQVLLQDRTWTSSSGVVRELTDLTPTHRRNLLGWLVRNSEVLEVAARDQLDDTALDRVVPAEVWVAGTPLAQRLRALIDREDQVEQAKDRARQVARSIEFERSGRWPDR